MSYFDLIILICTVAGLIIGVFTVVDRLISIKSSRPILEFSSGMSSVFDDGSTRSNVKKVSTIFLGTKNKSNSIWGFACPYFLENNSALPITNITVALQYLSKYSFDNFQEIKDELGNTLEVSYSSDIKREINFNGYLVEVRYHIALLRPGEKRIIFDPLKFQMNDQRQNFNISGLVSHLQKVEGFNEICIIDAIVLSEQCPPMSKRIKFLWFSSTSLDELSKQVGNAVHAFWAGHYPRAKYYFILANPFKKKKRLIVKEYADLIIPTLKEIKLQGNCSFYYWPNPMDCGGAIAELSMPFFNYYQLTGDISTDEILKKAGFREVL